MLLISRLLGTPGLDSGLLGTSLRLLGFLAAWRLVGGWGVLMGGFLGLPGSLIGCSAFGASTAFTTIALVKVLGLGFVV